MTKIKLALVVGVIGLSVFGGYQLAQTETVVTIDNREEVEAAVEETARRYETQLAEREGSMKEIVEQLQQEVIARLQRDESGGKASEGRVFYTHDPQQAKRETCARIGGLRDMSCDSWGVMQFKISTIIHYSKVLYDKDLTEKQALLIALDDDQARALASDIIFKVEGGVWNWSAANNDASYYSYQIPFIRSLMEKIGS